MGVMLLAWSGAGIGTLWPIWSCHAWTPLISCNAWTPLLIPVAWLIGHAVFESQWKGNRFLQFSLLHTLLLLQVGP